MTTAEKKQVNNRRQKRVVRTRKRLKEAALDVFCEKGVNAATVADITDKADLGKGTLYQHFADKDQIVITLVEDAVEHLCHRIYDYDTVPETLEDMLEYLLNVHYRFSKDSAEEFLLLFQGKLLVKLQSEHLDELEEPYLKYLEVIEDQITRYVSPNIDSLKVRRMACAVAGFVFGFLSFAMIGMTDEEIDNSVKHLRRVFVRSLSTFLGR